MSVHCNNGEAFPPPRALAPPPHGNTAGVAHAYATTVLTPCAATSWLTRASTSPIELNEVCLFNKTAYGSTRRLRVAPMELSKQIMNQLQVTGLLLNSSSRGWAAALRSRHRRNDPSSSTLVWCVVLKSPMDVLGVVHKISCATSTKAAPAVARCLWNVLVVPECCVHSCIRATRQEVYKYARPV